MIFDSQNSFPAQKKASSKKTESWRKDCINAGEELALYADEGIRKNYETKRVNYDLYSDILDQSDIEKICNPLGIRGLHAPAKMQNYPICNPKIDLLVGESIKRRFDWKVRVINDDAISAKEEELKDMFSKMLESHLTKEVSDDKMREDIINFQKFKTYEFQDLRERRATHILKHLYHKQRLDYKFAKGFKDALICAEEIYQCDIIAGEPVVERLNPLNVHVLRMGESPFIEDSDIIVIVGYHSPGKIIDDYHEYLTEADINMIEKRMLGAMDEKKGIDIGSKSDLPIKLEDQYALAMANYDMDYGSPFDANGNIRVTKVYWKSMRKLLKVYYYDEQGDKQCELYDESYKVDESKGEEAEPIWVNEWWEGHKIGGGIGNDSGGIYVKMQPRPLQFRSMENPSKCHPGIVGTIYNTNDNEGVSLMDRMKPYQYLYNVLAYNTNLMIAKNKGKIMRMDLASIPEHWKIDQWLSYAEGMNIAVFDSFKEGNKGAAQGKVAGTMNNYTPVIDMEMGNSIQLYMNMMAYIKQEMGEIAGVSQARQGQISSKEAVGNVEREVSQSSHITEYWFAEHDLVKIRVLETLLETAKFAWKDKKNKKVQYVLDDGSTQIFEIDGEDFNEVDYDLAITNGAASAELMQSLKQLAHAGIQNGIINFTQLMDIYSNDSIASVRRKIQAAEEDKKREAQEDSKRKQDMQREALAAEAQMAEEERKFKREEWDREDARNTENNETKLVIAQISASKNADTDYDNDGAADQMTIEKLRLDARKLEVDKSNKDKAHAETVRHNKKAEEQKDEELKIKKKVANKKPSS